MSLVHWFRAPSRRHRALTGDRRQAARVWWWQRAQAIPRYRLAEAIEWMSSFFKIARQQLSFR
jgi:hypothetical protein